jgi:alpha-tubulin suppressor-like RCC1 family protein
MKTLLKFTLIPLLLHTLTSHAALTVTNIASGNYAYHSLFLKSDGSLWVMGYNDFGQLGDGTLNKKGQIARNEKAKLSLRTNTAKNLHFTDFC